MSERPVLQPTADHPITITPTEGRVVVRVGDVVVANTEASLTLQESTYPAVQYIPLDDVRADVLVHSDSATYCPYKGDAGYYSLTVGGTTIEDAVWTYEQPYAAVADIAGRVAFYADKVDISVTTG